MPTLRQNIRSLPRDAWILCVGAFVNRFGSFVIPLLVFYLADLGYSKAQAGVALSAYGGGALVSSLLGGFLADRLGRRTTIVLSMFGAAATMLALSQASSLPAVLMLAGLAGSFGELYRPATSALLTDLVRPEQRVAAFAAYRLFVNLGFAAGPATAGFLASKSYFYVFLGDAITSVVFGIVALAMLPAGTRAPREHERRGEATRAILGDRAYLLFLLSAFFGAFMYFQGESTLPLHVRDSGLTASDYGILISLNGLVVVLLELPIAAITQRMEARTALVTGMLLLGFGFALTGYFTSAPLLGMTVVVWTLGEIVGAPIQSTYVAALAPEHLRGRYQGALNLTYSIALLLAPTLGTLIYSRNDAALWALCGVLGAAGGVCVAASRSRGRAASAGELVAAAPDPLEPVPAVTADG